MSTPRALACQVANDTHPFSPRAFGLGDGAWVERTTRRRKRQNSDTHVPSPPRPHTPPSPSQHHQQGQGNNLFDFRYLKTPELFEKKINGDARLQEHDEEFLETHEAILERFFSLFENIHKYHTDYQLFLENVRARVGRGAGVGMGAEGLFVNVVPTPIRVLGPGFFIPSAGGSALAPSARSK